MCEKLGGLASPGWNWMIELKKVVGQVNERKPWTVTQVWILAWDQASSKRNRSDCNIGHCMYSKERLFAFFVILLF